MEILKLVLIILPALLIIFSGILKITKNKKIVDMLTIMGVGEYLSLLGLAEILFALLFLYPPTRNIGFIFLICYFSGALATDLSHKNTIVAPVVILVILFVVQYINSPALFF